ncbi:uncharacterized protein C11orf52 homolog isoform X2 [Echinops telfairi]|uniref:Uncharacterized protein C11orf52 homolog isoform X2 n=1 Tax=Echinops telfairi TaxID=9371 RepID=A0AC55DPN9_ECHTE|nr:uncharacterized protein C11orf52 homolog isoform X2 [Echinops telfairi]
MGNQLCCGGSWGRPSACQRRSETGNQKRQPSKQQQQPPAPPRPPKQQPQRQQWQQCHRLKNDTKGPKIPRRLCEWASDLRQPCRNQPGPSTSAPHCNSEDSSVHYADILVYNQTRSRTVQQVKEMQIENATEYATLRFPEPTPRYHSKNGTLV